jgi:DNA-directed RNA polymerase omega subunit
MPLDNISELKRRVPGGKYALARAIAERARQLQSGATPLTEVKTPNPLSVAIEEIIQGKVSFHFEESSAEDEIAEEAAPEAESVAPEATPPESLLQPLPE